MDLRFSARVALPAADPPDNITNRAPCTLAARP
jgi:hypothetical protein